MLEKKTLSPGLLGVIVSLAVSAVTINYAPPAEAQTESYITEADEAAACEGVCNTFVPPQTEAECEELMRTRFYDEYFRHSNRMGILSNRRAEEWEESLGIFFDEMDAITAVRDERIKLAKAAYAVKFTGLTAAFAACLAKATATGPLSPGAYLLCSGLYGAGVAAAANELNNEMYEAREVFNDQNELASDRLDDREEKIKALYDDRLIPNEKSRHQSTIALIDRDLGLCLERVNG